MLYEQLTDVGLVFSEGFHSKNVKEENRINLFNNSVCTLHNKNGPRTLDHIAPIPGNANSLTY